MRKKIRLTPKQEKFIDEYLVDLNATQAAIRAGYSAKHAHTIASQLLSKTQVSDEITKRRKALADDFGITRERVVKEMARLAFFNVKSLFDDLGNPKSITQLSEDAACAINGLDVVTTGNYEIGVGQIMKYKIPDKNKALENLAKMLGYLDKDRKKEQQDGADITIRIVDAVSK